MKKTLSIILLVAVAFAFVAGCASKPAPKKEAPKQEVKKEEPKKTEPLVKRPDILDHKNYKWGKEPPDWVDKNIDDLEALDKYKNDYVFKFESPRSKDLQGAELWTKNFTAATEIAQQVKTRVQVKAAAAAAGDINQIGGYMEQVVKSFSDATFSNYKQKDNYWVQMRYYKADGSVDQEAYTYIALYTIPKNVLDDLVRKALEQAGSTVKPKTEQEKTAQKRVQEALSEGL